MKMGEFNRHRMSPLLPLYETVDSLGAVGGGLARNIESFKASLLRRGFSQQMLYGHHGHTKLIRDHVIETAKPFGERSGRVVRAKELGPLPVAGIDGIPFTFIRGQHSPLSQGLGFHFPGGLHGYPPTTAPAITFCWVRAYQASRSALKQRIGPSRCRALCRRLAWVNSSNI